MCGIFGYVGIENASERVLYGLKELEYRGYDSAGIAAMSEGKISIVKSVGKISFLEELLEKSPLPYANVGIGHTRWATHGKVTEENCHPHLSFDGKIALVHNGVVENVAEIRAFLEKCGIYPVGQTDSELVSHLVALCYNGDIHKALCDALERVNGSYAIAVICREENKIAVARKGSPLIVGKSKKAVYISSDIPALSQHCEQIFVLEDGESAVMDEKGIEFFSKETKISKESISCDVSDNSSGMGQYGYYMEKEIYEIPSAVADTYSGISKDKKTLWEIERAVNNCDKILFVGCGTAFHAAAAATYMYEKHLSVTCRSILASEFLYFPPVLTEKTLCIFVSQSGETADTVNALRYASQKGAYTVAVTNVRSSSICFYSNLTVYTAAQKETAVASTKAYSAQLTAFYVILQYLVRDKRGCGGIKCYDNITDIVFYIEQTLKSMEEVTKNAAKSFKKGEYAFFIGRGLDYVTAREGALKLKETSGIPCEALAAGELKHGTLALIEKGVKVFVVATQRAVRDKIALAIEETRARGAEVTVISQFSELKECADNFIALPDMCEEIMPVIAVIPLQMLALYTSVGFGLSPDKPRNLAKSVTVE